MSANGHGFPRVPPAVPRIEPNLVELLGEGCPRHPASIYRAVADQVVVDDSSETSVVPVIEARITRLSW
jgi:hypothetical protein